MKHSPVAGTSPVDPADLATTQRADLNAARGESPGGAAAPPVNFLTSVTDGRTTGAIPDGWQCGVKWRPEGCDPACLWLNPCDPLHDLCANPDEKEHAELPDMVEAYGFDMYHSVKGARCTQADVEARAAAELAVNTPAKLAAYYNLKLRSVATVIPGDAVPQLHEAVGLLLEARATHGPGGGQLPVSDRALPAMVVGDLLTRVGTRYTSLYGTSAVVGPGVTHLGPYSADPALQDPGPGRVWLYVHNPIDYALGPIEQQVSSTSHRKAALNETKHAIAERRALLRLDPCGVWAVLAELPRPECGE